MFELEDNFNMRIEASGEDEAPAMRLSVNFRNEIYNYMKEWYEVYSSMQSQLETASSEEEVKEIKKTYHNWKWNFLRDSLTRLKKDYRKPD